MINYQLLFVIYDIQGLIRLRGVTASSEFIQANTQPGDSVHWGDEVARQVFEQLGF